MLKKFNQLSFVIGAFFAITAVILFANELLSGMAEKINLYSAAAFLAFGVFMIYLSSKEES
ncbi:hypothetical protein [Flavihumibacter petaseus]|uniref:Uncharacterized protein n=1 Tax=Flavihumibacter petaseus NBRC 106054 TaxID=1220578 RepID=A0A0E9MZZ9_9BACT|nr:hypothetical protein [Flavihumibacter petaseus]GAO43113.1 hypothetical protein FPE01S_02_02170 [Flavihumibacter petaseus NBRC 106054]